MGGGCVRHTHDRATPTLAATTCTRVEGSSRGDRCARVFYSVDRIGTIGYMLYAAAETDKLKPSRNPARCLIEAGEGGGAVDRWDDVNYLDRRQERVYRPDIRLPAWESWMMRSQQQAAGLASSRNQRQSRQRCGWLFLLFKNEWTSGSKGKMIQEGSIGKYKKAQEKKQGHTRLKGRGGRDGGESWRQVQQFSVTRFGLTYTLKTKGSPTIGEVARKIQAPKAIFQQLGQKLSLGPSKKG